MALKDILVHIDDGRHCRARLDAAIALAAAHQAHLIGLYVADAAERSRLHPGADSRARAAAAGAACPRKRRQRRSAVRGADHGAPALQREWRCEEGRPSSVVALHGRYADIVIAGQRDPTGERGSRRSDHARPARPVGRPPGPGGAARRRVPGDRRARARRLGCQPAGDAGRQRRAAAAGESEGGDRDGDQPEDRRESAHGEIPSADICLHLARHGIRAEAQHHYADDIGVGAMLLSRAADEGIDLIVCGAYGHARWRELVLGGVTRHLLAAHDGAGADEPLTLAVAAGAFPKAPYSARCGAPDRRAPRASGIAVPRGKSQICRERIDREPRKQYL